MTALAHITPLPAVLEPVPTDPTRRLCPYCDTPVLTLQLDGRAIIADLHEWEPRAACGSCLYTRRAWPDLQLINCARCADTGYTGMKRPPGWMLAIDMAWGDEIRYRIVGPKTDRRTGEALHPLHICWNEWRHNAR